MNEERKSYWNSRTKNPGYCERFLKHVKKSNWLGMLKKAIRKIEKSKKQEFKNILEIGGGSQYLSRFLCDKYPKAQIICTDIATDRLEVFNNYYATKPDNLTLIGDINAETLPFNDEEFDLIVGDAVVSQFENSKRGFLELNRCLKKGGHAIFVREPVVGYFSLLVYKFMQKNGNESFFKKIRVESKKVFSQWIYEFIFAGFKVKVFGGWSGRRFVDRLFSFFPRLLPCAMCFVLEKKITLSRKEILDKK
ncbi:MAG: methyltransferase domain-containing protein [Gammaproteobacteria bacterium]|nr:methyltransferase domain-containing protein [Gammaproteobacteria bacterium]